MRIRSLAIALLLAACSAGSSGVSSSGGPGVEPEPDPDTNVDAGKPPPKEDAGPSHGLSLRHEGMFARKVLPAGDGYVVLYDRPVVLREAWGTPSRALWKVNARGEESALYEPEIERQLIDVAVHPSGNVTLLEAGKAGWFLVRIDASGAVKGKLHIVDPGILDDLPALTPSESISKIEVATHDAGRIAADGEQVFGATRTGRHSVIAYRWEWAGEGYVQKSRALVVPPHSLVPTAIYGGTYDTFGQLEAHYGVWAAVDRDHVGYVGVSHARLDNGNALKAHKKIFGETLVGDPDFNDAYVTRIDPAGTRIGTSVVGTEDDEQIYDLRAGAHGAYVLGRSERWNAQGTGFDAMAAHVDGEGKVTMRRFDVAAGDIAFDALEDTDGSLIVVGASGYSQNPSGASIVEGSQAFARRVHADGTTETLDVGLPASAPRHNEARFIVRLANGDLAFAGMTDGPGTHSHDGNPSSLRANGWLQQVEVTKSLQ